VLNAHWSSAKVDSAGLAQLLKTRQQMQELGYVLDAAPAVMYFLTRRLGDRDIAAMQRLMPRKSFVETWRKLEDDAKELDRRLAGKEAAVPSLAWKLLSQARPETILFLETTGRHQAVTQKIRNFFGKWRQMKARLPLPEMTELLITPDLPVYPKLAEDVFYLLLDGKLRSRTEIVKFLKPFAPPPAPPPPPPKRGRAAKVAEPTPAPPAAKPPAAKTGKKGKPAAPVAAPPAAQKPAPAAAPAKKPSAKAAAPPARKAKAARPPRKKQSKPAARKK
jgi:tRNA nucleotidyltransferase (CCA-adding enzyme)